MVDLQRCFQFTFAASLLKSETCKIFTYLLPAFPLMSKKDFTLEHENVFSLHPRKTERGREVGALFCQLVFH